MRLINHYKGSIKGITVYYLIFDCMWEYSKYVTLDKRIYDKIVNDGKYEE